MSRRSVIDWPAVGHRMRVTRLALGLSEQQAADGYGITLRTYRRWEKGHRQTQCAAPLCKFCLKYDVSMDWLICGDGRGWLGAHLRKNIGGKIAILPAERHLAG